MFLNGWVSNLFVKNVNLYWTFKIYLALHSSKYLKIFNFNEKRYD